MCGLRGAGSQMGSSLQQITGDQRMTFGRRKAMPLGTQSDVTGQRLWDLTHAICSYLLRMAISSCV